MTKANPSPGSKKRKTLAPNARNRKEPTVPPSAVSRLAFSTKAQASVHCNILEQHFTPTGTALLSAETCNHLAFSNCNNHQSPPRVAQHLADYRFLWPTDAAILSQAAKPYTYNILLNIVYGVSSNTAVSIDRCITISKANSLPSNAHLRSFGLISNTPSIHAIQCKWCMPARGVAARPFGGCKPPVRKTRIAECGKKWYVTGFFTGPNTRHAYF